MPVKPASSLRVHLKRALTPRRPRLAHGFVSNVLSEFIADNAISDTALSHNVVLTKSVSLARTYD